jgi:hypothetical protein
LLTDYIEVNHKDETELRWQHYEQIKRQISYNLRHIFKFLDFTTISKYNDELIEATTFLKAVFLEGKTLKTTKVASIPKAFILKYLQPYIFNKENFLAARYELMLYQSLSRQLQSGDLFIRDSINHQSLESDLIPLVYWKENKQKILTRIDLEKLFLSPQQLIHQLKHELEQKIKIVNQAILDRKNKDISIKKQSDGSLKWSLIYNTKEEQINHNLYKQFPLIDIVPILNWVDDKTGFTAAFKHILEVGGAKEPNKELLIACIVALGTNHGIGKYGESFRYRLQPVKTRVTKFY